MSDASDAPGDDAGPPAGLPDDDAGERTIIRPRSQAGRALPAASLGHVLPIGTRLFDYEITGLIGEGGFGIVYHAVDHSLQRRVAIKEYMPASMVSRQAGSSAIVVKSERHLDTFKAGLKSFVNEARLLARFDHPSLVKVYRFWEENGTAYMVMPYYEGPTLKDALAALGRAPAEGEIRAWLDPLLDALAVLHHAQCFHRDIAPDNVLLTPSGPLLLDFGAARRVIGDMTHALTVMLKPGYAPIEQYGDVASMSQGAWTDFYALASVVYYAITGRPPVSSVERLMDDRLQPLSQLVAGRYSPEFLAGIDRALSVRPQDRPQNDAQFRAALGDPPRDAGPSTRGGLYPSSSPVPTERTTAAHGHGGEPYPATRPLLHQTVPGTLVPELATELMPGRPVAGGPRTGAPAPAADTVAHATAAMPPAVAPALARAPAPAPALQRAPASVGVGAAAGPRRLGWIVATVVVLLAGGVAAAWWTTRTAAPEAVLPAAPTPVAAPATPPAVVQATPAPPTAPAASATLPATPTVTPPTAGSVDITSPGTTARSTPATVPATGPAAAPPTVPAAVAPATTPATANAEPTARTTTQPTGVRERPARDPAATTRPQARTPAAATTTSPASGYATPAPREPAAAAPANPSRTAGGARCSDILQKASLEPLTSEEAAYLRRNCQ